MDGGACNDGGTCDTTAEIGIIVGGVGEMATT